MMDVTTTTIEIGAVPVFLSTATLLVGIGIAWGRMNTSLVALQTDVRDIKKDLVDLRERFVVVEDRVDVLWNDRTGTTNSPRQLNDLGHMILRDSGIRSIIEARQKAYISKLKEQAPETAYDAERAIIKAVEQLPKEEPELVVALKDGAFKTGQHIDDVLYVGGIYLRDLIFEDIGFSLDV